MIKELKNAEITTTLMKNSIIKEARIEEKRIIEKAKRIARIRKKKAKAHVEIEVNIKNLVKKYELIQDILNMSLLKMENFSDYNPNYEYYLLRYIKQGIENIFSLKTKQIMTRMKKIQRFYSNMHMNKNKLVNDTLEITILINDKDKKFINDDLLQDLIKEYGINIRVQLENHIMGGAIIKTSDESICYDSTFEQRLKNKRLELTGQIFKMVWP